MPDTYLMTIIVPVYNEVESLDRLAVTLLEYFDQSPTTSRVLFIDDGSTDGSFEKIVKICQNPGFDYLQFKQNRGLSTAIKAGIDHATTELIGYIDADLQTTPFDFDLLLAHIEGCDAVVGYRAKRQDTLSKRLQSRLANFIRRSLINDGIRDTGCPLKVIRTQIARQIPFFDGLHRFIPALVQLLGGSVRQLEVRHFERKAGYSKFTLLNRSIKPLQDLLAYRWMSSRMIRYEIVQASI
jgi:dolichol-phosphate mannosyltransferase